jgi:import receptor subunit TOM22
MIIVASDISEVEDDDDALEETLAERLAALLDIVPPAYRKNIYNATSSAYSWTRSGAIWSGKAAWVISTSALLLGVPWALAFSEEQQVQEMEREMHAQQSANEVG